MPSEVDCSSSGHVNPIIFQLEKKPKSTLRHEIGAGSRCLRCACPGLDLHYWRKICKVCSCRMDDHDVILPKKMDHGQIVIGRLFDLIPEFENKLHLRSPPHSALNMKEMDSISDKVRPALLYNVRFEDAVEKNKLLEYTWVPTTNRILAEKYFNELPQNERPIAGTEGALYRRHKLQYQLPNHDSDIASAKFLRTDFDKKEYAKFVAVVKEKVVGVGKLVEFSDTTMSAAGNWQARAVSGTHGVVNAKSNNAQEKKYGECHYCHKHLQQGEITVVTEHGSPDDVWHVNCFRCEKCSQKLVDLLYFYKDGVYFCGRHFADSVYPRCFGCDELIFSKEYTFAEERNWHVDHFRCFGCDLELGGHRYMVKDEQPYCFICYEKRYAKTCNLCRNKIAPDQQRISFNDLHWHANDHCFQ